MSARLIVADARRVSLDRVDELSAERARRAEKYRRPDDRRRCIAAGLLMNRFLGGARVSVDTHGKPVCDGGVCFNLSHSGDYAVIALSRGEVGVDIERLRVADTERLGKIVFCQSETELLHSSFDKISAFFGLWTKKEALLKCMGEGFCRSAKSVDVSSGFFEENGRVYRLRRYKFSDYEISLCLTDDEFPDGPEFVVL